MGNMSESWIKNFQPVEREIANIDDVVNTFQWGVYALSGLMAIFLFILASHRSREGDFTGALLSAIAATVCAVAPFLASYFL